MKKTIPFILILIILKPIFDFTWNWKFLNFLQAINLNRIVSVLVPLLLLVMLNARLAFHRKAKLVFSFPAIAILFISFLSLLYSFNFFTIEEVSRNFAVFIIYLLGVNLIDNDDVFYKYLNWIIIVSMLPTFIGYLQLLKIVPYTYWDYFGESFSIIIPRVSGGYRHPVQYLGYIIICLPCLFFLYVNKKISFKKFLIWIAFTLPMAALTLHRTAIFVILFQVVIYLFFWKKRIAKWILMLGIIVILAAYWDKIYNLITGGRDINSILTLRGRTYYWSVYLKSFINSDMVIKLIGYGHFYNSILGFADTHNDFLRFLYAHGIFGFGLFIMFIIELVSKICKKLVLCCKNRNFVMLSSKYFLGLIIVISWLIYNATTTPLISTSFGWNFALILTYICNTKSNLANKKG